jgi:hypothetical protein
MIQSPTHMACTPNMANLLSSCTALTAMDLFVGAEEEGCFMGPFLIILVISTLILQASSISILVSFLAKPLSE